MPELPEVETTCRGIAPHILGKTLTQVSVMQPKLRYPVPETALTAYTNTRLLNVARRAKYLLFTFEQGTLLVHLGMSGSLRITDPTSEWRKHDHWQLSFSHLALRYHDPRKFGFLLTNPPSETHPLLAHLGVEPLSDDFTPHYLYEKLNARKVAIKTALMRSDIVVGIGNIYACESLFLARIHPQKIANTLTFVEVEKLHQHIQQTLERAISQGGSTLKDFVNPDGQPGYFAQTLQVYGRTEQACYTCGTPIQNIKLTGRSSFFCPRCQQCKETLS
ncbi:MAG: bifunctional DNA-formamidopyrimidine glycosylase/DNA-(apurinic or apyrimidinic site) lyase [Proteobacteria bacterium]|nr:bifunctional DNA-formamidopyrimidine glycosylase/DNA-(apurinic or apyrimidinic site) lyase [Pseudomonadota bacterium]